MPRPPTNTLILTNLPPCLVEDPTELIHLLHAYTIELIALPKFGRVLLICPSATIASSVKELLGNKQITVSYSLRDNELSNIEGIPVTEEMEYLELPSEEGSKRFLISPPLSPPVEWDNWNQVEEDPNPVPYSSQDLSHLLWEKLGGGQVKRIHDDGVTSEVLLEQQKGVPAIIIDSDDYVVKDDKHSTLPKTQMPM